MKALVLCEERLILDTPLDLQQYVGLPIVQLGDLVELEYSSGESFHVARFNGIDEHIDEFGFASGRKRGVKRRIFCHIAFSSDGILNKFVQDKCHTCGQ